MIREWLYRQFSTDWAPLRFQPILFLVCWLGTIHVWATDNPPIGFAESLGHWGWPMWLTLSLSAPVMLAAAYAAVYLGSGYVRYMGLWLRLGANLGQLAALSAFLATFISQRGISNDYRLYFLFLAAGIVVFLVLMIVRDVWQLALTERIAARIRSHE